MEDICSICLDTIADYNVISTVCMHKFHEECIKKWIYTANVCPLCRKNPCIMLNETHNLECYYSTDDLSCCFCNSGQGYEFIICKNCKRCTNCINFKLCYPVVLPGNITGTMQDI